MDPKILYVTQSDYIIKVLTRLVLVQGLDELFLREMLLFMHTCV